MIEGLKYVYERSLRRYQRKNSVRTAKVRSEQAAMQELLQYLMLSKNIFANTLNPAIEESIGDVKGISFIYSLLNHMNKWLGYDSLTKEHFVFLEEDNSTENILAGKYTFRMVGNEPKTTSDSSGLSELSRDEESSSPIA